MSPAYQSWLKAISFVFILLAVRTAAIPAKKGGAASVPQGITTATDGGKILDKTVTINGLPIRYRISAPANMFTAASGVPGGAAAPNTTGTGGINVMLHGDGGDSFFDFPNQAMQNNLMGVAVLAPNTEMFWGGGSGPNRVDGVPHAAAVNALVKNQLAQDVAFDSSNVYFTGISGGSLLLSGFFVPAYGASYKTGVVLNCGALTPQVPVVDPTTLATSMKIHFQSTSDELKMLQTTIPQSVAAYEAIATKAGMTPDQIGKMQTVDNTPSGGGHCGFDGKAYTSGNQLMANNYNKIMSKNATGMVLGIGNVLKTVVGNEKLKFTGGK